MSRELRVGLLTLTAVVVLAVATFMVGERRNLFARTNTYTVRFENVAGLAAGNPVQLNGVTVGRVEDVVLPEAVDQGQLKVWISVERRFAERVREDSEARIKTLGLLGDKYVEISSGSPASKVIPSGGEIPTAPATDVDRLIASGEDLVENVVAIAVSMRTILGDMEQGKGILGQLLTDDEAVSSAKASVVASVESLRRILDRIERGEGTLGSLLVDDTLATRVSGAVGRLERVLGRFESGEGALPALLNDPASRERLDSLLAKLDTTADSLGAFAADLNDGSGLLPRLINDEEYGSGIADDLEQLLDNLNSLSGKLESGDGTLGKIINDPSIYDAVDQIVIGINESKLLRWAIRNRQKAGIKRQARDEIAIEAETAPADPGD